MNRVIVRNKKLHRDFDVIESYEAGIVLKGTEVKSIRLGRVSINDAYCKIKRGEVWIKNMHISPYEQGNIYNHDPLRDRKLLLHKREIRRLTGKVKEKGLTLIPVKVYLKNNKYVKLEIALCKGKKLYDKREDIKRRDQDREMQRIIKAKYGM